MDDDLPHSPRSSHTHTHTTLIPSSPPFAPSHPRYRATSPTSSEPPLFSSDDGPEAADITNYQSPRYKKKRAGPWWSTPYERPAARNKKAKISRNFDSGVFMMSDSSEATTDLLMGDEASPAFTTVPLDSEELERKARVLRRIQHTIDREETDTFEFSQFEIRDSDLHHLASLKQMIRYPPDASTEVPSEGQYRSLVPTLHVDLSRNQLCSLSPRLFELEHLTSLILRGNDIHSLPPQIGKLKNLRTLDLAGNLLTHLPAEVLSIAVNMTNVVKVGRFYEPDPRLHLNMFANPLFGAAQMAWRNNGGGQPFRLDLPVVRRTHHLHCPNILSEPVVSDHPRMLRFSPVSYFDRFGQVMPGSVTLSPRGDFLDRSYPDGPDPVDPLLRGWQPTDPGTSLFCAAFFKALEELPVQQIREYLGSESTPTIDAKLALVEDKYARTPRRQCHTCGKEYVILRAEWLEFWRLTRRGEFLPIKVQVCSWSCVPELMVSGKW